jgi:chromosome segregation ATPase
MYENWSNGQRKVNGEVRPPIVLRSETELFIAQNAHNLIWDHHWDECTALDNEIISLERAGADPSGAKARLQAVFTVVKCEIDVLIKDEIAAYREERKSKHSLDMEDRIARVEKKLKDLRNEIDDMELEGVEEALEKAEEAFGKAEEAYEKAVEAYEKAEEALDAAES